MGNPSGTNWINISAIELDSMLKKRSSGVLDFVLLDVRNPNEQDICVIEGTDLLIPVKELSSQISNFPNLTPNRNIVIYCKSGIRSEKACEQLWNLGFKSLYHLESGILEYIQDVNPDLAEY